MLESTALVKMPIFALNKSSASWEQAERGGEQSYGALAFGPGRAFGLMVGKRMVLSACEGACQEAMGNAALGGSTWYFRGS